MGSIIPGEAAAECGSAGGGNVTEGMGGEKNHVKDSLPKIWELREDRREQRS